MKKFKGVFRFLLHFVLTLLILVIIVAFSEIFFDDGVSYKRNDKVMSHLEDGPYIFFLNDSTIEVSYIKKDAHGDYFDDVKLVKRSDTTTVSCEYFPDSTVFSIPLDFNFSQP